jgi:putative membrane protein
MMWQGNGMGGWGPLLMTVGNLLVWVLVVVGVVALIRYLRRVTPASRPAAEELLAERFARGEIDEQEYRDRLAVLRGARAGVEG